ncbi:MAG: peroxiredoxin [Alphaproteobacteria bacterium]|nr:MAG: peroxiredoxin [Alphaproteobacteria bacterium]
MTISVGEKIPSFNLKAVAGKPFKDITIDNVFIDVTDKSYPGKWLVMFFYPKDFTFVCPTEIAEFARLNGEFQDRDAQLLTGSTDGEFCHWAWRKHQDELRDLPFPMLADNKHELTSALGILDKNAGVAQRAVFIIDPQGIVRFSMVTDLKVGRNPKEVLRVLDALQSDELCPCNWSKGEETIDLQEATAA